MKTALITGSSRGIGKAIALRLARDGFRVIVHSSGKTDKANAVASEILKNGGEAEVVSANLCDVSQTEQLRKAAEKADVLILNASVQYRNKWEDITVGEATEQINCNFLSSLMLIQAAAGHMKENRWGRIVTIGSVQEAKPHPDMLVYSATKAAQTNMVKSLALQLAGDNITVNNIAPGVIYTDRNVEALSDPVYAEKVTRSIPLGFYGEPEDCAGIVSLICSDEGRYITGQCLFVDGGKSVQ